MLRWISDANNTRIKDKKMTSVIYNTSKINPISFQLDDIFRSAESRQWLGDQYTYLCLMFPFKRKTTSAIVTIYIPSTLTVIVSWLSFYVDVESPPARVTLGIMPVLTIITQILEVRKMLPPINYVTAIDIWLFVCLIFVVLSLCEFALSYSCVSQVSILCLLSFIILSWSYTSCFSLSHCSYSAECVTLWLFSSLILKLDTSYFTMMFRVITFMLFFCAKVFVISKSWLVFFPLFLFFESPFSGHLRSGTTFSILPLLISCSQLVFSCYLLTLLFLLIACEFFPQDMLRYRQKRREAKDRWTEILPQIVPRFVRNDSNNSSNNTGASYVTFANDSNNSSQRSERRCPSLASEISSSPPLKLTFYQVLSSAFGTCFRKLKSFIPTFVMKVPPGLKKHRSSWDERSKVIFPTCFLIFVGFYWIYYKNKQKSEKTTNCDF